MGRKKEILTATKEMVTNVGATLSEATFLEVVAVIPVLAVVTLTICFGLFMSVVAD